jgi:hypothetical protein
MLRRVETIKYKIIKNTQVQLYETMAKFIPLWVYGSQVPAKAENKSKEVGVQTRERQRENGIGERRNK